MRIEISTLTDRHRYEISVSRLDTSTRINTRRNVVKSARVNSIYHKRPIHKFPFHKYFSIFYRFQSYFDHRVYRFKRVIKSTHYRFAEMYIRKVLLREISILAKKHRRLLVTYMCICASEIRTYREWEMNRIARKEKGRVLYTLYRVYKRLGSAVQTLPDGYAGIRWRNILLFRSHQRFIFIVAIYRTMVFTEVAP